MSLTPERINELRTHLQRLDLATSAAPLNRTDHGAVVQSLQAFAKLLEELVSLATPANEKPA